MSKRKKQKPSSEIQQPVKESPRWLVNSSLHLWIIFAFSFLLYANTLGHEYTQDDAIVIYDNMFTTQGVEGIPGILGNDTFYGFFKEEGKDRLVSGGRYRPLTLLMFALEWELFGRSPAIEHLVNILFFSLTCCLLYLLLFRLFKGNFKTAGACFIAFFAAIFFAAHPVHTEAVANIKGRDEIIALLGSIGALYFSYRAFRENKPLWNLFAGVIFFLALLAKENAITFLAIIPLTYFFFTQAPFSKVLLQTLPVFIATIVFLVLRGSVIGWEFGAEPLELMNNPFVKIAGDRYIPFSASEKIATILFTLLVYLRLLIFPHPLTHDYYPRHIEIMNFGDWQVILSLIVYIALVVLAIRGLRKKDFISYSIFFYLITLSIVSNLLFPVGTNMSERFLFMPSVGFCLALAMLGWKWAVNLEREKITGKSLRAVILIFFLIAAVYAIKTFSRNFVWKDNYTLFTSDIHTSTKSAKLQNAVGGELINHSLDIQDENVKRKELLEAVEHLKAALRIHPNYKNAYLLLGNAYNYLKEYEASIENYQKALQIDPGYQDALNNLGITYRDAGRYYGEQKGDLAKSIDYLLKAYELRPTEYEIVRLLGVAFGISQNHPKAIEFFTKALELAPEKQKADAMFNLGSAYFNSGDVARGQEFHQKAMELDPEVAKRMRGG